MAKIVSAKRSGRLDSTQDHHFYASTAFAWGTGTTREAAIRMALQNTGDATKGLDVYSVRVGLPQSAEYEIEYYTPKGVPLSEKEQARYTLKGRNLSREV
jgi:hypothetical protein